MLLCHCLLPGLAIRPISGSRGESRGFVVQQLLAELLHRSIVLVLRDQGRPPPGWSSRRSTLAEVGC